MNPRVVEVRRRLADTIGEREEFDLLEAVLWVAAEEYAALDIAHEARRVQALGEEASRRIRPFENFFARVDGLRTYLFEDLGFAGDADHYDDPRNSFLNEVLDRRTGIPVTLSILYVEVARRAGLEARGVALPGHFVVRVADAWRACLVDPFGGGQVITEEDCRDLVARTTGRASLYRREVLEGCTPRDTLLRLLQNLKRIYLTLEDHARALAAVDRLLLVDPDDLREIRDRGLLLAHLGRTGAAVADLEAYLALAPKAPDAESVRGRLAWLLKKMS